MNVNPREPVFQRLHPATFFVVFWGIVRRFLIPGLVVLFFGGWPGELFLMWLAVPAFLWSAVKYLSTMLAITEDAVILREGLTGRKLRRIPLHRIRSIETRRTLVHRLFNVDDVIVHTGSNAEAEATLSAVGGDTVSLLRSGIGKARPDALPSDDATEDGVPNQWRCSTGDLIGYGMVYYQGFVLWILLLGFIWQADLLTREHFDLALRFFEDLLGASPVSWLVTGLWFLLAFWVAIRVLSVIWSLVTFHPFGLSIEGEHVHLRFGLLFHRNLTLPDKHFHMIQIEEKPFHRFRKKVTLHAWTAATLDGGEDEDETDREWNAYFNKMVLHPFIGREKVARLIEGIAGEPDWERLDWQDLDPSAFGRIMLRGLVLLPVCAALSVLYFPWGLWSFPLLGSWLWWAAWVEAKHTKYAVTAHGLWLRTGYLSRAWRMIGHAHIQSIETLASPLDRRAGLARLRVDGLCAPAGFHAVSIPFLPKARADSTRILLADLAQRQSG